MSALTWAHGKRLERCTCVNPSALLCAASRALAVESCPCRCHAYRQADIALTEPQPELEK